MDSSTHRSSQVKPSPALRPLVALQRTPTKGTLSSWAAVSSPTASASPTPQQSPSKKGISEDDIIHGFKSLQSDIDLSLRATMYSITAGERDDALETLTKFNLKSKAMLQKTVYQLGQMKNVNNDTVSNLSKEKRMSSRLRIERDDFKRMWEAAIKERDECKKSLAALGGVLGDFDEESISNLPRLRRKLDMYRRMRIKTRMKLLRRVLASHSSEAEQFTQRKHFWKKS